MGTFGITGWGKGGGEGVGAYELAINARSVKSLITRAG